MAELEAKKFKYKKDGIDTIIIWIIIFTVACFALIFWGMQYFQPTFSTSEDDRPGNGFEEFNQNATELQRQIEAQLGEEL